MEESDLAIDRSGYVILISFASDLVLNYIIWNLKKERNYNFLLITIFPYAVYFLYQLINLSKILSQYFLKQYLPDLVKIDIYSNLIINISFLFFKNYIIAHCKNSLNTKYFFKIIILV